MPEPGTPPLSRRQVLVSGGVALAWAVPAVTVLSMTQQSAAAASAPAVRPRDEGSAVLATGPRPAAGTPASLPFAGSHTAEIAVAGVAVTLAGAAVLKVASDS